MRYVYIITAANHAIKVGVASNTTMRLAALQTGCPFKLKLFARFKIATKDLAYQIESETHRRLGRRALEGEWFRIAPAEAVAVITSVIAGAPKNRDAEVELQAARHFKRKAFNRILVCPYCQHTKQSTLDDNAVRNSRFRCTACNALFPGRRFLIRRVA